MLELTPDGSGTFAFDQGGIKGVVTYETAGSYMADIHWGMARTYDFYKNVLGRESYDAAGAPIYNVAFPSGVATVCTVRIPASPTTILRMKDCQAMVFLLHGRIQSFQFRRRWESSGRKMDSLAPKRCQHVCR